MKRIASALLLSIFLYNIIGYYCALSVLTLQNKSNMSAFVQSAKDLQTLRIHLSEIKNVIFYEDKKELFYKGEMYDIKDKSLDGDYVVFHCVNDKKEKILLTNLDKHIQNNLDTKSSSEKKQNTVSKNIFKDYLLSEKLAIFFSSSKFDFPPAFFPMPSDIPLALFLPPPEISFS